MSKLLEQVLVANIYLQPVEFSFGIITNTLSISILCTRALRSSPCTHYFLAYAIFSIIYISLVCSTQFLRGFYIDWANSQVGCKINFYIIFLPPFIARIMLVLASFDRYCSSSSSRQLRLRSTIRAARLTILIATVLSSIYMSPMIAIYYWNETTRTCQLYSNQATNIYTFSQVFLYYILAPILMIIFGFLTVYNIRQHAVHVRPQGIAVHGRRTEGQLTRMLILQISVHLVLTFPFGIIYSINAFDPSTRTPDIIAVRYILVMWQQCDYFVSFFLYVLSGKVYRQQLIKILKCTKCHNTQIHLHPPPKTGLIHKFPVPVADNTMLPAGGITGIIH